MLHKAAGVDCRNHLCCKSALLHEHVKAGICWIAVHVVHVSKAELHILHGAQPCSRMKPYMQVLTPRTWCYTLVILPGCKGSRHMTGDCNHLPIKTMMRMSMQSGVFQVTLRMPSIKQLLPYLFRATFAERR